MGWESGMDLERVEIFTFLDGEKTAEMYRDLKWEEGREGGVRGQRCSGCTSTEQGGSEWEVLYYVLYYSTVCTGSSIR